METIDNNKMVLVDKIELARLRVTSRQFDMSRKSVPYTGDLEGEKWKLIFRSNHYYVSDFGRVRKSWTDKKGIFHQILLTPREVNGRLYIEYRPKPNSRIRKSLHELVGYAFLSSARVKSVWTVRPKDGNYENCNIDNLAYMKRSQQRKIKKKIKNSYVKTRTYTDKDGNLITIPSPLSSEECEQAYNYFQVGYTQTNIAKIFKINQQFISKIIKGDVKYK